MTTFLPLAMFLLIFSAASPAQQNAKPAAQATQANPCESPTTQMEMNQCSGEEYRTADADLNAVYKNLLRKLQQSADEAHQQARRAFSPWVLDGRLAGTRHGVPSVCSGAVCTTERLRGATISAPVPREASM